MSWPRETGAGDGTPGHAICDFCGHRHACYVGGRPSEDAAAHAVQWERHVCLGCVMRAATPGAFDGCGGCMAGRTRTEGAEARDA